MPHNGRNSQGRFTQGNCIAYKGWLGLVNKRFNGDFATAKAYVAQLGRYSYGKMCDCELNSPVMVWRKYNLFFHPGTPEQFVEQYNKKLDFTLDDIEELNFVD
jgi:hypothetical protein